MMAKRARRFLLLLHIGASVGWFGSVIAFLAVALVGVLSEDSDLVRAAYLIMAPIAGYAILPLNLVSFASGILSSLLTRWGLVRHYWVLIKLLINTVATVFLVLYLRTLSLLGESARVAADPATRDPSPVLHAAAAAALLLAAMTLAIYKPRGVTGFGKKQR